MKVTRSKLKDKLTKKKSSPSKNNKIGKPKINTEDKNGKDNQINKDSKITKETKVSKGTKVTKVIKETKIDKDLKGDKTTIKVFKDTRVEKEINKEKPVRGRRENKITLKVMEETELMKFLIEQLKDHSRNNIKSILAHQQVSIDNKIITQYNHPLAAGQEVTVNWNKVRKDSQPQGLEILYEDEDIIVIVKEAGLLSIATAKEKEQTAYSILSEHVKKRDSKHRIFIVHRLDRETSGIMLFAKSEKIKESLQKDWTAVVRERSYIVITEGFVSKEKDTITSWLKENKTLTMSSSPTPNKEGQKAVTHYKVLKRNKNYSMLEVNLETGRKNQIRVHMQEIGHSIIGDKKYGSTVNPIRRLGLHARVLAFVHPSTGEEMRFETEIPRSFLSLF